MHFYIKTFFVRKQSKLKMSTISKFITMPRITSIFFKPNTTQWAENKIQAVIDYKKQFC